MSIFSNIRKSRQQAKEHHAKLAEQRKKDQEEVVPYRHVPTHAAADAFASAPPSWREASDRPKIIEQNRRRSAMVASGHPTSFPVPNFPRVGSSLSVVSYPGKPPAGRMPRAHSYAGVSPYADGSRDIIYSIPDVAHSEPEYLQEQSPPDNNSDTASSSGNLEISLQKALATSRIHTAETSSNHPLQPNNRSQDTPDPAVERHARATSAGQRAGPSLSRDSRPPPSTRGFHAIQQTAHSQPIQVGTAPIPLSASAIGPTIADPRHKSTRSSRHDSSSSIPGLIHTSTKQPSPLTAASPVLSSTPPSDFYLNHTPNHSLDVDFSYFSERVGSFTAASEQPASRPSSKLGRFTEMEPSEPTQHKGGHEPMASSDSDVINFFPEPMSEASNMAESPKNKGRRLSRTGGGKLLKKNRQ